MTLPDWLEESLRPALADLQGAAPIALAVSYDGESLDFRETAGSHATGVWVGEARGPALTVHLVDHLQEQFFPESDCAWGEARPLCPGHAHPASPGLFDERAVVVLPPRPAPHRPHRRTGLTTAAQVGLAAHA